MRGVINGRYKVSILWVCAIAIVSITFLSCSAHRATRLKNKSMKESSAYELKEVKKSPDSEGEKWTIYSRKIEGTNFYEYKIEGAIAASAEAGIAAFRQDILDQAAMVVNKKYPTYEIVSESQDSHFVYIIHHEPFPLKDTEMSIRYDFFNNEDGTTGVTWHEAWDESQVPPSKKLSRVETFRGSWNFAPTSDNSCQAINSVQFDPKGMPMWLVKPMIMKFLKNGLKDIREATSR